MKNKNQKWKLILGSLIVVGIIYACFLQFKISQFSELETINNADYLIVLGAKVNGTVPSLALAARIDAAAEYLKENPSTIAIASGGQGRGEDISEAESIKRELMKQGISESRIILEDQSTDTYENIAFSKRLTPTTAKLGVVVTNTFHVYRGVSIARDQGLEVDGLPAKTPAQAVVKSYLREYLAITKFYLNRYILD
jgi:uncharacterized SAM-binding protein YcdF (DUF218 family)